MPLTNKQLNDLSYKIINAAIEVHRILGPGLLENAYEVALTQELKLRGLKAENQIAIPLHYKGEKLDLAYRADIIVEDAIILELKATQRDDAIFLKQLQTYLKLTDKRLGLLINFNHELLREGIQRVVYKF